MAHTGTMDLGRNVQAKPNGNPWPLIGLAVAAVAIVAAVWFASSAGFVGGSLSAKPAAGGRSDEQIEAQRSLTLAAGRSSQAVTVQRNPLDFSADRNYGASGAPVAGSLPVCHGFSPTSGLAYSYACSTAAGVPQTAPAYVSSPSDVIRMLYVTPRYPLMLQPAIDAKAARILALAKAEAQADVARYPFLYTQAPSSPSGTFHAGNPVTTNAFNAQHDISAPITLLPGWKTIDLPARRDRVGGP